MSTILHSVLQYYLTVWSTATLFLPAAIFRRSKSWPPPYFGPAATLNPCTKGLILGWDRGRCRANSLSYGWLNKVGSMSAALHPAICAVMRATGPVHSDSSS